MGFTPEQVGRMSLFQYAAGVDGVNAANRTEESVSAPTDEEFNAALAAHGLKV
jgi:hypothetical protein